MYIITIMSYSELGTLIRDKRVSLNNASLFFGYSEELIDKYFSERVGYRGYVVGLRGRLNRTTAEVFARLDTSVKNGERIILEAEIDEADLIRYTVNGISEAATAMTYGLSEEDIVNTLDSAIETDNSCKAIEVLCIPYIKNNGHVRITKMNSDNLEFAVEGITFVKTL